jgi:hypothetical protein
MLSLIAAALFASVDEAAIAGLTACRDITQRYECGGYVYRAAPGGFGFTPPVSSHMLDRLDLGDLYLTGTWVADFHTHPCVGVRPLVEVFSMQDVLSNKGLHFPGYMLSLCTGYVRRWADGDPEDDFEVDFHSGRKLFLATGHIVGMIDVSPPRPDSSPR